MWVIVIIFLETCFNYVVEACPTKCEIFIYKPHIERIKYLARLPNHKKLNELALIGTHLSLSYLMGATDQKTQELNLKQQLKYGIRVLDISVQVRSNSLFLDFNGATTVENFETLFEHVLQDLDNFLDENPGEFVIMFLHERKNKSKSFDKKDFKCNCKIIKCYTTTLKGGWRLTEKWRLDDEIGLHRGRILLASWDGSFAKCAFEVEDQCEVQNIDKVWSRVPSIFEKWMHIAHLMSLSYLKRSQCYVNDISFYDGEHSRRAIAKDSGYDLNKECIVPMNFMMAEGFQNPGGLNIVLADFVTQELIDAVNDCNFPNSSWRIGWER